MTEPRGSIRVSGLARGRIVAGGRLIAAVVLMLLLGLAVQTTDRAFAAGGGPEMALSLVSGGSCSSPTKCEVSLDTKFEISVDVVEIPAGGYPLVHAWIHYGDALGDETSSGSVKDRSATWADCEQAQFLATHSDQGGNANQDSLRLACQTFLLPPGPVSSIVGSVYTVSLTCTSAESSTLIELLPLGESPAGSSGSKFLSSTGADIVPKVNDLTINCTGAAPTPPPVGGIALDADLRSLPLEAASAGSSPWFAIIATIAAIASAAVVGGAAWYARRRRRFA